MARRKPDFTFEPRLMTTFDVATYMRRGEQWLVDNLPHLKNAAFPAADDLTGLYDQRAIDRWLDQRYGLSTPLQPANDTTPSPANDAEDPFLAAFER